MLECVGKQTVLDTGLVYSVSCTICLESAVSEHLCSGLSLNQSMLVRGPTAEVTFFHGN